MLPSSLADQEASECNTMMPCCCVTGEGLLGRFLEVLMRRLLLDSGAGELTGLAADALLPLILSLIHI